MAEDREYQNYGGRTMTDYDGGKVYNIFEIASRLVLQKNIVQLTFDGWTSTDAFNRRLKPLKRYMREFIVLGDDYPSVRNEYAEVFAALETSALAFLEASPDVWEFESLTINANQKIISLSAKHKTKERRVTEQITTEEGFDIALVEHPGLVNAYFTFVWSFGAAQDEFLASLKPVQ